MSWHEHDDLDAEDLVARARRGLLSPAEQGTLARALEARPELETAYRVGVELDRAGAVQGGDEALIARAADAALARAQAVTGRASARPQAAHGSRLAIAAALALSLISASGIATALWTGVVAWPFAAAPARPAASSAVREAPAKAHRKAHKRAVTEPTPPAPALEVAPASADVPAPEAPAARHRATPTDSASQAAALFHDANSARRDGDHRRAQRLYARLVETHPGSDEAGLARVSLGRLLLKAGDARGAERQFRMYLAAGGQLSEEALVGQAQSSGQLRHTAAEQQAWRRLLASYPNSVYAAQARQRLAAIDAEPHEGNP